MYYYSKKSSKKIIHISGCFHTGKTDGENIERFETLPEAYEQGYRLCRHCNPLLKYYKDEMEQILDFCQKNGLSVYPADKSIIVTSTQSKWKISLNKHNKIVLYHKNTFKAVWDQFSEIPGYHLQGDVKKESVVEYLKYIIDHDRYRTINPLDIHKKKTSAPPKKGTKRYKSNQRKLKYYERRKAIRSVLDIIDSLGDRSALMNAAAV